MPVEVSPISSRKIVPPFGLLEQPALLADRARERAALVAEQLRLEQRLGSAPQLIETNFPRRPEL